MVREVLAHPLDALDVVRLKCDVQGPCCVAREVIVPPGEVGRAALEPVYFSIAQLYHIGDPCTDQAAQSGTLQSTSPTNSQQQDLIEIEQQYDFNIRLELLELNHNLRL